MMGHDHELGQRWVPEDGIVRQADVGDVEVDELGAVVVALAEGGSALSGWWSHRSRLRRAWWAVADHMAL